MNNNKFNNYDLKDNKGLISIIIPTYNRKEYLAQAIESVNQQKYPNIEIIVVDDNSTDGTENLMKNKYSQFINIQYFKNKMNKGPGYNRLLAFNKAQGEYIVFLDDDDYYTDFNFFYDAIEKFSENQDLAFVSANNFIKNEGQNKLIASKLNLCNKIPRAEYLNNFQSLKYPKPQSTFTTIFNKKVLNNVNLNDVKMVNDTIIYLRALLGGDAAFIENMVGVYRIHNNNISKGCSSDFIIQNLDEKHKIYNLAKDMNEFKNNINSNWLNEQVFLTLDYYIAESPTNFKDFIKIIKWISKNIEYKKYLEINNIIKRMIKKYMSRYIA